MISGLGGWGGGKLRRSGFRVLGVGSEEGKLCASTAKSGSSTTKPATAGNCHRTHFAVQSLDLLSLSSPRVGQAAEDLSSLPCAVFHHLGEERAQTLEPKV